MGLSFAGVTLDSKAIQQTISDDGVVETDYQLNVYAPANDVEIMTKGTRARNVIIQITFIGSSISNLNSQENQFLAKKKAKTEGTLICNKIPSPGISNVVLLDMKPVPGTFRVSGSDYINTWTLSFMQLGE